MTRQMRITKALEASFSPERLEVVDESAQHAGHAGAGGRDETHYRVTVVAAAFEGVSRLDRQRRINTALAAEFASGLHALSIRAQTPRVAG